jgi:peptide deformylase
MLETMKENHGVGLAANQVGLRDRVFVMGTDNVGYAFFNPEIVVDMNVKPINFEEGCLSFPGLFIPIQRADSVTIKYTDMDGVQKEQTFTGLSCRTILHEVDHLNGITFTTKVSRVVLDRAKRKVKANQKKLARQYIKEEKDRILAQAAKNVLADMRKSL